MLEKPTGPAAARRERRLPEKPPLDKATLLPALELRQRGKPVAGEPVRGYYAAIVRGKIDGTLDDVVRSLQRHFPGCMFSARLAAPALAPAAEGEAASGKR
ncbi:MAG: hypothetical protein WC485_09160 [Opitutaceae bacterium]